jgi:excisionase family DNA binding protein
MTPTITRHTPIEDLPQLLTVEEFAAFTGTGHTLVYDLVKRGELEHVRFGRLVRIPRHVLERPAR